MNIGDTIYCITSKEIAEGKRMIIKEFGEIELLHIANAGFLVKCNGKRVLIDALHTHKQSFYETVNRRLYEDIRSGVTPFGQIDILLFTHSHADHFDSKATADFLIESKETYVVAPPDVVRLLIKENMYYKFKERVLTCEVDDGEEAIEMTILGVKIKAMRFIHQAYLDRGKRVLDFENYGYLIDFGSKKILHVGDAEINDSNFKNRHLAEEKIDIALLNFPFLILEIGQKIVDNLIFPSEVGYIHFPDVEHDKFNWIDQAESELKKCRRNDMKSTLYTKSMAISYK